ncbi:MAG: isochorismatase family protein [Acidobacteriota bacterium]
MTRNMSMIHQNVLDPARAALVVVDIQEGFRHAIPDFTVLAARALTAIWGFQSLGLPVLITEQYPKGLGRTAEEILCALAADFEVYEKTAFSSCGSSAFITRLEDLGVGQIVLCGLETHVCVNQTAHDLLHRGFQVHLLTDCVRSRFERDKRAGLAKMRSSGVLPSSIELALFELMGDSKHEKFKEIQSLIK